MVKIDLTLPLKYNSATVAEKIREVLKIPADEIKEPVILRRTLTLGESEAYYKCTVAFSASSEREAGLLKMRNRVFPHTPACWQSPVYRSSVRPVVVGAGPAGLFAALALAEAGARPIVLERGEAVEDRAKTVSAFHLTGRLNPESNVQFGEGGAGTYSDGKLKVGSMDVFKWKVLSEFILAGAGEEIAYSTSAHLGTDCLGGIVCRIREKIKALGGEFLFCARLLDLVISDGKIQGVKYMKDGCENLLYTSAVILATGHSARDVLYMLRHHGIEMVAKGFGIGMRIEHPREYINSIVYGKFSADIAETASYHLVTHLPNGRSVYSFCMCPGGTVVAATGSDCSLVTNGMSELDRMGDNSNAALLVSMTPADFGTDPFSGIAFQKSIEERAYSLTESYRAPAQTLENLLHGTPTVFRGVKPSYPLGVESVSAEKYLPQSVTESLRGAFSDFDSWLHGYLYPEAVLTGPETRTTSPVRILRDENSYECPTALGLYPAGEGAGYSGGIVSSAVDGLRAALHLVERYGGAELR